MSDREPCPHQPQLVELLGHDGDRESRGHLQGCARCQAELALLRDGFTALGDDVLAGAEQVQQRIAARVMPQILADLARPAVAPVVVRPAPRPRRFAELRQLVMFGALTAVAPVPAALYWLKVGDAPLKPVRALALALLPLCLLPAVLAAPRRRRAALIAASGLATAFMLSTVDRLDLGALQGAGCLLLAGSGSLLPALVVLRAAMKTQASALSGALLGAAIGGGGAAIQRLFCGSGDLSHTLVFHLGPFFFLIALAGLVGSWVARTTAPADPAAQTAG